MVSSTRRTSLDKTRVLAPNAVSVALATQFPDVARFAALHVLTDGPDSEALTRLMSLHALLAARGWQDRDGLIRRWTAYGVSHGAWAGSAG